MLNVHRSHWMVCENCKVKGHVGDNLFSSWQGETVEEWQRNDTLLGACEKVEPFYHD